jgi:hypothetical protein
MQSRGVRLESPIAACTLLTMLLAFGLTTLAWCEPAAPYTEAAAKAIGKALEQVKPSTSPRNVSVLVWTRATLEWFRAGYRAAGHDFDATILQVCEDFLHQRPGEGEIFMGNLMVIGMIVKECEAAGVDCLLLFPPDVAQSIQRVMALRPAGSPPSAKEVEDENRSRWQGFLRALSSGQIEDALTYFVPQQRARYRQILGAFPERLSAIAAGLATIGFVNAEESQATFRATRMETIQGKAQKITYYISFQKIAGAWFIESF